MSKKKSGCGNCNSGCGNDHTCNGECGGKCGDKNCKCKKDADEKGDCTGGCGKKKENCQCAKMKTCWFCKQCQTKHTKRPVKCVGCNRTEFEERRCLPSD